MSQWKPLFVLPILVALLSLVGGITPALAARKTPSIASQHAPVAAPHITWRGQFGFSKDTPDEVYCLMGSHFLRSPVSSNLQSLIDGWIAQHPRARMTRVFNFGPILVNRPNLSQTYVWLTDGKSNLNEYLVAHGACPGITMRIPDYQNSPPGQTRPSHFQMEIPDSTYESFLERAAQAEQQAQKQKLGVWKHGTNIF